MGDNNRKICYIILKPLEKGKRSKKHISRYYKPIIN